MRRLGIAATVLAALALGSPPSAASHRTPPPTFLLDDGVTDEGVVVGLAVEPDRHELEIGRTVAWTNGGALPHELEERNGLFRWGPIAPGETDSFRPWAAGRYVFREALEDELGDAGTWERGSFTVAPVYEFRRLRRRTEFWSVRWASRPAPEGFVYEVQAIGRRGARWLEWKPGTREATAVWRQRIPRNPYITHCTGFRARLRDANQPERALGWGQSQVLCVVA